VRDQAGRPLLAGDGDAGDLPPGQLRGDARDVGEIERLRAGQRRRDAVAAANALRAELSEVTALTDGERHVLTEWLDRIAGAGVMLP
jgi:hypothetical protein